MNRTLIALLFFSAGIAFTIACAAKPAEIGEWPNTLNIFIIGAVVCTLALIAWRLSIKSGKTDVSGKGSSSTQDLFAKLHECRDSARQIGERFDQLDTNSLCEAIDEMLINHMNPFVENRHVLIDNFGMSKGSDILLRTAFAERQFNRVWSASSDHCLPEAKISFELALSAMDEIVDYVEQLD